MIISLFSQVFPKLKHMPLEYPSGRGGVGSWVCMYVKGASVCVCVCVCRCSDVEMSRRMKLSLDLEYCRSINWD